VTSALEHEEVLVRHGARSGLTVIVAVHSTTLGQAVGGCRIWPYPSWRDGLDDALRLSAAMTHKCALAGLPAGGGKSVIPLPPGSLLAGDLRRDVLLDLGDAVHSLSGRYGTAEDVGTTALDMLVVRERTPHVFCLPESHGGIGEPSEPTAAGVITALRVVCGEVFGSAELAGRRFAVHGLGQVGGRLARRLAAAGARLVVGDIDETKRDLAAELGAEWVPPADLLGVQADVLVPASLGGLLTTEVAQRLRCAAVAGPANNQLASGDVAEILAARGILWAPDTVVNGGGAIYGVLRELRGQTHEAAMERVGRIGDTLTEIFASARDDGLTPHEAASQLARRRVADAQAREA
jgi:leucine dehydrogenase